MYLQKILKLFYEIKMGSKRFVEFPVYKLNETSVDKCLYKKYAINMC